MPAKSQVLPVVRELAVSLKGSKIDKSLSPALPVQKKIHVCLFLCITEQHIFPRDISSTEKTWTIEKQQL